MNRLAIVIPYYKIDFFEETLQSVASQTDRRFTLYIGNDKSPDNPLPLIEKYFPNGDYKYYNYGENLGGKNLALQWERILENVEEEWFQILGDDDMISENFVEEFYRKYCHFANVNFLKTRSSIIDENGKILTNKGENISEGLHSALEFFFKKKRGELNTSLSEHIFRNEEYRKVKFKKYPLAWHSDDYILLQLSLQKQNFYFLKNSLVTIKATPVSISGTNDNIAEKLPASIQFHKDLLKIFRENGSTDVQKTELAEYLTAKFPTMGAKNIYLKLFPNLKGIAMLGKFYLKRVKKNKTL